MYSFITYCYRYNVYAYQMKTRILIFHKIYTCTNKNMYTYLVNYICRPTLKLCGASSCHSCVVCPVTMLTYTLAACFQRMITHVSPGAGT